MPFTVTIGLSEINSKASETAFSDIVCPPLVTKDNWLGQDNFDDEFTIGVAGNTVTASRVASNTGWGMNLQFICNGVPDVIAVKTYQPLATHRTNTCLDHRYCVRSSL